MWTTLFCALLVSLGYFFPLLARTQTTPARISMVKVGIRRSLPVSINGAGPYNFIFDTGANNHKA